MKEDVKNLERQLKALANKRRLAILKFLKTRGEASIGEISDFINLSFNATSKHLAILANVDILEKEQRSLLVFCRFAKDQKPHIKNFIHTL